MYYSAILTTSCFFGIMYIFFKLRGNPYKIKKNNLLINIKTFIKQITVEKKIDGSFKDALNYLNYLNNGKKNYEYSLPWYFAINSNFVADIDKINECKKKYSHLQFYYFKDSILLNFDIEKANIQSILSDLLKVRFYKPLDGIILSIDLSQEVNIDLIYEKLVTIQKNSNLILPIYIVFEGLESFSGFPEVVKGVPEKFLNDIFGWSNNYSLSQTFSASWLDEMFNFMFSKIEKIKSQILITNNKENNFEIFKFFNHFEEAKDKIEKYIKNIFERNNFNTIGFLRGVYFTGSLNGKHVFINDLLDKKILLERNIAKHILKETKEDLKLKKHLKIYSVIFTLFSGAYFYSTYNYLSNYKKDINHHLFSITKILNKKNQGNESDFLQNTKTILEGIMSVSEYDYWFFLTPISWFSGIQDKIIELLDSANDKIILKAIIIKLEQKYKKLGDFESLYNDTQSDLKNIFEHNSFKNLNVFVNELYFCYTIESKLNEILEDSNFDSLTFLISKLFDIEIPKKFYDKTTMFRKKLKTNLFVTEKLSIDKVKVKNKLQGLFADFNQQAFIINNFLERFDSLDRTFIKLEKSDSNFNMTDLVMLQKQIANIITFGNSSEFNWIQQNNLNNSLLTNLFNKLSKIYGQEFCKKFANEANEKFQVLKVAISNVKVAMVGSVFYISLNNHLKITDTLIEMQGMLNSIMTQSFMQYYEEKKIKEIEYGQTLTWNTDILSDLDKTIKEYSDFMKSKITQYPRYIQNMIVKIAKLNLKNVVKYKITSAQNILTNQQNEFIAKHIAVNMKESNAFLMNVLTFLADFDEESFSLIKNVEVRRCLQVVDEIENEMKFQKLYTFDLLNISMDNLKNNLVYFPVNITSYLNSQKDKAVYFSKDILQPVLTLVKFLRGFDSSVFNSNVALWEVFVSDINTYGSNGMASSLFTLETFIKDYEYLNIVKLQKIVQEQKILTLNQNYFNNKLVEFKKSLNDKVNVFIKSTIDDHFEKLITFYKEFKNFFPFSMDGDIVPANAFDKLQYLIKLQEEEFAILQAINPKINHKNLDFLIQLNEIILLIKFLLDPTCLMSFEVKYSDYTTESYEKNLQYLIAASVYTDSKNVILFPNKGKLKIGDNIVFKFALSNSSNMYFSLKNKKFSVVKNEAHLRLNRKEFIEYLMQNLFFENGASFIKFDLEICDAKSNKKTITYALPVEIAIDGKILHKLGSFLKLKESVK